MEWMDLILKAVALIILAIVTGVIVPWIKQKVGADKLEVILSWMGWMVTSAENLYGANTGETKREYVLEGMTEIVNKLGYDITPERLRDLLESAVDELHKEQNNE